MTAKITYEFDATPDNASLLVAINNAIAEHLCPTQPLTPADKEAFRPAFEEEITDAPVKPEPPKENTATIELDPIEAKGPIITADIPTLVETKPKPEPKPTPDISSGVQYNDMKMAAKDAKKTHGQDFAMQVLTDHNVKCNSTLGRSLAAIQEDQYQSIMQAWLDGPATPPTPVQEEPQPEPTTEPTEDGKETAQEQERPAQAVKEEPEPEEEEPKAPAESIFAEEEEDTTPIDPQAVKLALRAYAREHSKENAKELMAKHNIPSLPMVDDADQGTLTALFSELV